MLVLSLPKLNFNEIFWRKEKICFLAAKEFSAPIMKKTSIMASSSFRNPLKSQFSLCCGHCGKCKTLSRGSFEDSLEQFSLREALKTFPLFLLLVAVEMNFLVEAKNKVSVLFFIERRKEKLRKIFNNFPSTMSGKIREWKSSSTGESWRVLQLFGLLRQSFPANYFHGIFPRS